MRELFISFTCRKKGLPCNLQPHHPLHIRASAHRPSGSDPIRTSHDCVHKILEALQVILGPCGRGLHSIACCAAVRDIQRSCHVSLPVSLTSTKRRLGNTWYDNFWSVISTHKWLCPRIKLQQYNLGCGQDKKEQRLSQLPDQERRILSKVTEENKYRTTKIQQGQRQRLGRH